MDGTFLIAGWLMYLVGMAAGLTYVIGSFFAYLLNSEGLTKILCIVQPVSGLLLPWIGKGELAGHPVHSPVWWLLFGVAAVFLTLSTRPAGGPFQVVVMDAGPLGQMSRRRFRDRLLRVVEDAGPEGIGVDHSEVGEAARSDLELMYRQGLVGKRGDGDDARYVASDYVEAPGRLGPEAIEQVDPIRIMSPWRFEVWGYLEGRGLTGPSGGDSFKAVRTVDWQRIGRIGTDGPSATIQQVSECPHTHATREEARPCVETFARFTLEPPTPQDIGRPYVLIKAPGTYFHDGEVTDGQAVGIHLFGVVVPIEEGLLLIEWPEVTSFVVSDAKVRVDLHGDPPRWFIAEPPDAEAVREWVDLLGRGRVTPA